MEIALVSSAMPVFFAQRLQPDRIHFIGRDAKAPAITLQFATSLAYAPAAPSRQPVQVAMFPSADPRQRRHLLLDLTEGTGTILPVGVTRSIVNVSDYERILNPCAVSQQHMHTVMQEFPTLP